MQPAPPFCQVASGSSGCSLRSQDRCATAEALPRTRDASQSGNRSYAGRDAHRLRALLPLTILSYTLMHLRARAELRAASLQAAPAADNGPQASEAREDPEAGIPAEDVTAVADTLIREFRSRKPAAWRKLIAYSKRWTHLAEPVFDRYASLGSRISSMFLIDRSGSGPQHMMPATHDDNVKAEHS